MCSIVLILESAYQEVCACTHLITLIYAVVPLHSSNTDLWPFLSVGLMVLVLAAIVVTFTVIMHSHSNQGKVQSSRGTEAV